MDTIRLVCPECDAVHRVKNITLGKLYRCKKCKSGLITMQPAVLTCPACGATRAPAHIEVSRLVTCDECEQTPLMNLRIAGLTFGSIGGDSPVNPPPALTSPPPTLTTESDATVDADATNADFPSAITVSNRDDAVEFVGDTVAEKSEKSEKEKSPASQKSAVEIEEVVTIVEPRKISAPTKTSQSAKASPSSQMARTTDGESQSIDIGNRENNQAPAKISSSLKMETQSAKNSANASAEMSADEDEIAKLSLPDEAPIVRENPSENRKADDDDNVDDGDDFYASTLPPVAASANVKAASSSADDDIPAWGKTILHDCAELKSFFRNRRMSMFARPVFGWICLALLILLYGYALAVNSAQEAQLQGARRQLNAFEQQAQSDYDEMKNLLTRRIDDLEKERLALRGEKVALENDLRDYYNKFNEAQRKINLLNKAYSIGVERGVSGNGGNGGN